MIYGDNSSNTQALDSTRSEGQADEKENDGTKVSESRMPSVGRATLIRSFSRKFQKHSEMKTPVQINTPIQIKTPVQIKTPAVFISHRESTQSISDSLSHQPVTHVKENNRKQHNANVTQNPHKDTYTDRQTPQTSHLDSRNQHTRSRNQHTRSRNQHTRSRNLHTRSRKSKLYIRDISRRGSQAWSTSFYHGDIVDVNLLISASKLDSTLIRLFSNTNGTKEDKNQQNPGEDLMPFLNYAQSDLISMDPVMWIVYPMDSAQKEALEQELPYIEENIAPKDVMTHLFQNDILTHMDYNQLVRTEGQGHRAVNRLMVKTLQRRGNKAYPAFLEALQAHNYTQISQRLVETERRLRDGMKIESSDRRRSKEIETISARLFRTSRTTPLGSRDVKDANGMLSPLDDLVFSANQGLSVNNELQQSFQETNISASHDHDLLTNHSSSFESHITCSQPIIDSEKLEKQLKGLLAELEALQEVVTALKSAPSPSVSQINGTEVDSPTPGPDFETCVTSPRTSTQNSTFPETFNKPALDDSSEKQIQKSGSCTVF